MKEIEEVTCASCQKKYPKVKKGTHRRASTLKGKIRGANTVTCSKVCSKRNTRRCRDKNRNFKDKCSCGKLKHKHSKICWRCNFELMGKNK